MHSVPSLTDVTVKKGRILIKKRTRATMVMQFTLWSLAIFTMISPFLLDYGKVDWQTALTMTLGNLKMMFLQPAFNQITFGTAILQIGMTIALALLATLLSAVISFFLAILSAKNLAPSKVATMIIAFNSFIRAVPTVLWVLILAIVAGLGAVACVLGMMLHSIAYLTKAYAESFEEIEEGTIEALRASGSNWWHIIRAVVLPQSSSFLVSWTFLRFETNFDVAIAMGAAAAAGGIGFELFMASSFYYDLHEVGAITYCALIVALMLEFISVRIKRKLMMHS